ncbi:hypothetical protein QX229_22210 [Vibrio parahaemolyticus]|nr:hypothetical protein [Vibrio parahaemolyticus]
MKEQAYSLRVNQNENVTALFAISKVTRLLMGGRGQGSAVKSAQRRKFLAERKG